MFQPNESQYIIDAVDCFIRQNGLSKAAMGLVIASKLQALHQEDQQSKEPINNEEPDES